MRQTRYLEQYTEFSSWFIYEYSGCTELFPRTVTTFNDNELGMRNKLKKIILPGYN